MTSTALGQEFADALVAHFASDGFDFRDTRLVAAQAIDDRVIVLYREYSSGPVLGRRYLLDEAMEASGNFYSAAELAGNAIDEDILDPTGRGIRLDVDWADGLIDDPSEIEWVGFGEPARDERIEMPDKPGTSYSGSYSAPPT